LHPVLAVGVDGITQHDFVARRVPLAEVARKCADPNPPSRHTLDARAEPERGPSSAGSPAIIGR
jgi:hypothetical protein